jgi:hypothetical protein
LAELCERADGGKRLLVALEGEERLGESKARLMVLRATLKGEALCA